jgi:hypothetical protein
MEFKLLLFVTIKTTQWLKFADWKFQLLIWLGVISGLMVLCFCLEVVEVPDPELRIKFCSQNLLRIKSTNLWMDIWLTATEEVHFVVGFAAALSRFEYITYLNAIFQSIASELSSFVCIGGQYLSCSESWLRCYKRGNYVWWCPLFEKNLIFGHRCERKTEFVADFSKLDGGVVCYLFALNAIFALNYIYAGLLLDYKRGSDYYWRFEYISFWKL